ncbi:MAG: efflux RND transporter periplasmic adaptor subunit [Desulfovibrionaceae bacterium]
MTPRTQRPFPRAALAALALCLLALLPACAQDEQPPEQTIRALKTMTIQGRTGGQQRRLAGVVQARRSSQLSFEISGRVQRIAVDIGDRVEEGRVLATLDPEPYRLEVAAAESELEKIQANVNTTRADWQRYDQLYAQRIIAKSELDQVKLQYDSARSELATQQSRLEIARRNLRLTELKAPYSGHVAEKLVEEHEEVQSGAPVLKLDSDGAKEVSMTVPESLIGRMSRGMEVTVTLPSLRGRTVPGRVTDVGATALKANAFPVKVAILEDVPGLELGMSAEVRFFTDEYGGGANGANGDETPKGSGYLIPFQALLPEKEPLRGHVFVYDPETSTVRRVQVRISGMLDNMILVDEGIEAGQVIAVAGVSFLADGMRVKLMEQATSPAAE